MSEPATAHISLSATGYADGLGRRTLDFDREAGGMLERLQLRPEFGVFEPALRQRMDRVSACDDARFARVRAVERDPSGALTVLSAYAVGDRLCDLLDAATNLPAHEASSPSVDAALGFLLEVLPALEAFHAATGSAHGAVATGRITITSSGDVVLLDTLYGQVLERLQYNRRRLWTDFGIAVPPAAGPSRFDRVADISQAALASMMIVLGRPFRPNDYPDALPALINEVIEIAQIRGSGKFASSLHKFLHRALPLPARRAHASADEAAAEVRQIAREIGTQRCREALTSFVGDMNRVISDARDQRLAEHTPTIEEPFAPTPEFSLPAEETVAVWPEPEIEPAIADAVPEPLADLGYVPAAAGEIIEDAPDFIEEPPAPAPVPEPEPAPAYSAHSDRPYIQDPEPEPLRDYEPLPSLGDDPAPVPVVIEPEPAPIATEPEPEPVAVDEPPAPEPIAPAPPAVVAPPPIAAYAPVEPPQPVAVAQEPEPSKADPKRKRQNARRFRDKLRSYATPPAPPAPPTPAPPPPLVRPPVTAVRPVVAIPMPVYDAPAAVTPATPRKIPQPLREEAPLPAPLIPAAAAPVIQPPAVLAPPSAPLAFRNEGPAAGMLTFKNESPSAPLAFKNDGPSSGTLAFKNDSPSGTLGFKNAPGSFNPPPARVERREPRDFGAPTFGAVVEQKRSFPWRLAAAAVIVIAVGIGAGRKFLPSDESAEAAAPAPSAEVVEAAKTAAAATKTGTIVITTEPAGAHVLLDGKEMGDSPLTLENVPVGRHAMTFVTAAASVKKMVRVEAGKTAVLDVPVFSGWIKVFSPIPLEISENGRAIGSSEEGPLMLTPGRHQLTFRNAEFDYTTTQTVDIEAGEERPVSIQPTGELSANAVPWAEVWMNGKKIGETPVARLVVPLGTHEVVFKNPSYPDRRETVTVAPNKPVTASVDFTK